MTVIISSSLTGFVKVERLLARQNHAYAKAKNPDYVCSLSCSAENYKSQQENNYTEKYLRLLPNYGRKMLEPDSLSARMLELQTYLVSDASNLESSSAFEILINHNDFNYDLVVV